MFSVNAWGGRGVDTWSAPQATTENRIAALQELARGSGQTSGPRQGSVQVGTGASGPWSGAAPRRARGPWG